MKISSLLTGIAVTIVLFPTNMNAQQNVQEATDSIKNILSLAKSGDAKAQNEVGAWYYRGKHVKQDYNEAAQWWARSAKQGNTQAIGNLGLCYQKGKGVEQDSLRAFNLYLRSIKDGNKSLFSQNKQLADKGDIFCSVFIAYCCQKGIETKKDINTAIIYYTKAANKNSADAQREMALLYLNSKKPEQAVQWFKRGALNEDIPSVFYYGKLLHEGTGVKQDRQQGIIYLLKAAEADFPMGQYEVAKAYFDGTGIKKNQEQGAQWLIKAANNRVSNAQYELAKCYVYGTGVPVDFDQATSWFAISLQKGHTTAFKKAFEDGENSLKDSPYHNYLKGMSYYNNKDFDNALKQFKSVEKAKHIEGKTMQGVILLNKDYAKYNQKKGSKILQETARTNPMAMYLLGGMYETGKGVEKDISKTVDFLQKAAASNYAPALCYLGDMYYEGRGVEQNYDKAVEYYIKAKGQLSPNSAKRLASCYENGLGIEINKAKAEDILKNQNNSNPDLFKLIPMN